MSADKYPALGTVRTGKNEKLEVYSYPRSSHALRFFTKIEGEKVEMVTIVLREKGVKSLVSLLQKSLKKPAKKVVKKAVAKKSVKKAGKK